MYLDVPCEVIGAIPVLEWVVSLGDLCMSQSRLRLRGHLFLFYILKNPFPPGARLHLDFLRGVMMNSVGHIFTELFTYSMNTRAPCCGRVLWNTLNNAEVDIPLKVRLDLV